MSSFNNTTDFQAALQDTEASARLSAFLATGPLTVSIAAEREAADANPTRPAFLKDVVFNAHNEEEWYTLVLSHIATFTFVIASTTDIFFAKSMFACPELPQLSSAVTKLDFPVFYWFAGIDEHRTANPYLQMATLPNITDITLTMHTACMTISFWSELQQLELEITDPVLSQRRMALSLADVIAKYNFDAILKCKSVRRIRLEYLESELVARTCWLGSPTQRLD